MTLPVEVLARRTTLPVKPAPVTLAGTIVELRPLDLDADLAALHAASLDDSIWPYMSGGPFSDATTLRTWLAAQDAAPDGRPLVVRDLASNTLVGVANLMANSPANLKIELGSIWYGKRAQGTGASAEATFLMCAHAFALGYRRVEWKCDARNEPSRRAALAYGFTFEGIQQAHMIIKNQNRDTAWFRMLDDEWADRGPRLRAYAIGKTGAPSPIARAGRATM